jgi:threonine dehydrogenase-like Zn-dependent dehydrogenase
MGAAHAWKATDDIPARLEQSNGGRLADLVILATASPAAIYQAFACTQSGGTLLIFALPDPGTFHRMDMHKLWKSGIRIISSYAGNRADHMAALTLIEAGRIDVEALITHRLPLSRTAEGFQLVAQASKALKVIIEPQV